MWLSIFALACAPKAPPAPPEVPVGVAPVLPSPDAPLYAEGEGVPRDPLVAQVVTATGLPWIESLAGAATGLALRVEREPTLADARWAAVRSGYPHAIRLVVVGEAAIGGVPTGLVEGLQRTVRPGEQLGLVRARGSGIDRWIAVVGVPETSIVPFPRELRVGEELEISGGSGLDTWTLVSPDGRRYDGPLPLSRAMAVAGEWWVELNGNSGVVSVPVFVGMPTPESPPLTTPGDTAGGPEDAVELACGLIDLLRQDFDLPPVLDDATLRTLAALPLDQVLAGEWDREAGESRLRGAGFVGGPTAQVVCEGGTPALCLDNLLRTADGRLALLNPAFRVYGIAAQASTDGVTLVINMASE